MPTSSQAKSRETETPQLPRFHMQIGYQTPWMTVLAFVCLGVVQGQSKYIRRSPNTERRIHTLRCPSTPSSAARRISSSTQIQDRILPRIDAVSVVEENDAKKEIHLPFVQCKVHVAMMSICQRPGYKRRRKSSTLGGRGQGKECRDSSG
jgi:hypothetical protein